MTSDWNLEGSFIVNGVDDPGPVRVLVSPAETWFTTHRQGNRRHLSLYCIDRRVLLGDLDEPHLDAHVILPAGRRPCVGHHEEVHGHPADNERVIRPIARIETVLRYSPTGVSVVIRADTLPGELSRDDNFRPDRSPWTIRVHLIVPRAEIRALFSLSEEDAALVERRLDGA